ncbi:P27 family phage terminase small subunit [Aeromonas sp. CD]|uniref:P27 family phage terminase small subunit n=1 Tax=Aeromonas sp. CD TaxID=3080830 RepID=UPI00296776DA|nr:P27 family phage terminase small subunit [Aeromonas sp. CD]WOX54448.1 P27 family phage terminase small subunit [Aeromonas sp. CD]
MTKPLNITSKNALGTRFHKLICDALEARGDSPDEFNVLITLLAARFVSYKTAQDDVDVNGECIDQVGDKGQVRKVINPSCHARDKAYKDIFEGLKELGLTPKSKAALQLENNEAKLKREELLKAMQSQPQIGEDDL